MKPLETAVLFIIFNRLNTTQQVFAEIKKAQPSRLYIAADGPRDNKPGENEIVKVTREYILSNINWNCEVKTLFNDKNLGCKKAVSNAITWFFDNEEQGIILEDDCVPSQTFFGFCQLMLKYYANDTRIMMVSGTNHMPGVSLNEYFFSRHFGIWGWATWRRAWQHYKVDMDKGVQDKYKFLDYLYLPKLKNHFKQKFSLIDNDLMNTWDIQWVYACLKNYGLTIMPNVNLITNIGLTGTHNQNADPFCNMPVTDFDLVNIRHPEYVYPNEDYDLVLHEKHHFRINCKLVIKAILCKLHLYNIVLKICNKHK